MVESELDADAALLPETPEGYAPPTELRYPLGVLLAGSVLLLVVSAFGFGGLLWLFQGPDVVEAVLDVRADAGGFVVSVDATVAVGILGAIVVTTVVHELVHGLVYRALGYDVSYGVAPALGAFYVAAFHQFQARADNLRVALAPFVSITLLVTPLLAVPVPVLAVTALAVLVFNTAGSVGDLYVAWRIGRTPQGTLFYDSDVRHFYVFEPRESA